MEPKVRFVKTFFLLSVSRLLVEQKQFRLQIRTLSFPLCSHDKIDLFFLYRFTGVVEEGRPLFLPCKPPMPGAFVSVHFEGPPGVSLSICEAFVYTDQALPIERCPTFRHGILLGAYCSD